MTEHDVLVGYRLRPFTLANKLGNVSEACRLMGVHRSTYYRYKRLVDGWELEALNLCRVGLNTRARRLALVARRREPYERAPSPSTVSKRGAPGSDASVPNPRLACDRTIASDCGSVGLAR